MGAVVSLLPSVFTSVANTYLPKYVMVILTFILFVFILYVFSSFMAAGGSFSPFDLIQFILFAFVISYSIVYYSKLFLYSILAMWALTFVIYLLPIEYGLTFSSNFLDATPYVLVALFTLPPLYDLYKFYTNKQGATPLSTTTVQSAGSSHKKRK
jgi:hypothetical protein